MAFENELLQPRLVDAKAVGRNRTRVVLAPLERGFGQTLGNALRRILLSSMSGCAVTEVQIEGVLHEYSSIEGVHEDVIEILLNLKNLALSIENPARDEVLLTLSKQGEGPVVAGDIELDPDVTLVNPHHVIANLTKSGKLNMTLKVQRGRGYQPALPVVSDDDTTATTIGALRLDASFSPVRKVTYQVENARVDQRT
ncbi:MAG: DNA-directed RNA polymerase subunit alpha, partial [Gammaproteobacteria bacterium]|nr:DNA-directed RNA polymerase subunit alpha [Gammaproteobacteria bacterium]